MDILEELKYYCKSANPVGALMLFRGMGLWKDICYKKLIYTAISEGGN